MYYKTVGTLKTFLWVLLLIGLPLSFGFYYLNKRQVGVIKYLELLVNQRDMKLKARTQSKCLPSKTMPKTWLDVQKQVKDTVVQVFAYVDQFNWFEPYKTPKQMGGVGSGFFIDDQGYLVTNYHVVSQASSVKIQIPSFGRQQFDVEIVGVYPDKDVALLKLTTDTYKEIKDRLGKISYLNLGDSDSVVRTQEVLALGYPLGQQRLKSTLGIVSGREQAGFLQTTAPLNPGNSGGPSLNELGQVIGINFAGILTAQNVGYIIPINEVKSALKDMHKVQLLRKPTLGCIFTSSTPDMVEYLGNPKGGGWYIAEVFEKTILEKIGVKENDMLCEVNGYKIDLYGEMSVEWSEDKISFLDYLNRFTVGDEIHFVIYRKGTRKDFHFKLNNDYLPSIRKTYPEFEPKAIDYEVIAGMCVMNLTLNHVAYLVDKIPSMTKFIRPENQHEPLLLITNVFPNSQAQKARILTPGAIIDEVNGEKVKTLNEFRNAIRKGCKDEFLTIKTGDKMFAVLSIEKILQDEDKLSSRYFYKQSKLLDEIGQNE